MARTVREAVGMNTASPWGVTPPDSTRLISGIRIRPARVLLVDDEPGIAQPLAELLSSEFIVCATTRPREALASVLTGAWYDVILCDVMMPEVTGVDLHGHVHAVNPMLASRFVFMTGGVGNPRLRAALDALPNLVLPKPVDVEDLRELIRRRVLVHAPGQAQSA